MNIGKLSLFILTLIVLVNLVSTQTEKIEKIDYDYHRVIGKGRDKDGDYYIAKGDNSKFEKDTLRKEEIEYIVDIIIR